MVSITKRVWEKIDEDIVIRRALEKGIISKKNLAVYLIKEKKVPISIDAVISAIRRYKDQNPLNKKANNAQKLLHRSKDISLQSNLVKLTFAKNKQFVKYAQKIHAIVKSSKDTLLQMQGEDQIHVITNQKHLSRITKSLSSLAIKAKDKDIGLIEIELPKKVASTSGVLATVTQQLFAQDIVILDLMTTTAKLYLFFKQTDLTKAYDALQSL